MTPDLHRQLPTFIPVGIIQRPRFDNDDFIFTLTTRLRRKGRPAVLAKHPGNVYAVLVLIDVKFRLALGPVEACLRDGNVGGEAGASVALAANAVAENNL
jgi:hypothetical protein